MTYQPKSLEFQQKKPLQDFLNLQKANEDLFMWFPLNKPNNKQKFLIKKFIFADEAQVILDTCVNEFFLNYKEKGLEENKLPYIRLLFQLLVLKVCTNLEIDFSNVSTNVVNSDLIQGVFRHIENYEEVWSLIKDTISYKITDYSLNLIATNLPSDKELKTSVSEIQEVLKDLNTNNPELLKYMINETVKQDIVKVAKEELKEVKEEVKNKSHSSKISQEIKEDIDAVLEGR